MTPYWIAVVVLSLYFFTLFVVAQLKRDNSIVDMAWGPGFALVAIAVYLLGALPLVLPVVITLWALRLFFHITRRNLKKPEDFRYQEMRKAWGKHPVINAFFKVFMLQGVLLFIVVFAAISAKTTLIAPASLANGLLWLGLGIFAFGLGFEAIGDEQLRRFILIKKPGEVMTTGLWRYTRHPNYFGEATLWWGIYLIALAYGAPWWTVFSPLTITVLVRYISGVPLLEKKYENNAAFKAYAAKTSVFIPRPPKNL